MKLFKYMKVGGDVKEEENKFEIYITPFVEVLAVGVRPAGKIDTYSKTRVRKLGFIRIREEEDKGLVGAILRVIVF